MSHLMDKTKRQEKMISFLVFIHNHQEKFGSSPSIREICDQFSIPSTSTVNFWLERMSKVEWIKSRPGQSRSLQLTNLGYRILADREPVCTCGLDDGLHDYFCAVKITERIRARVEAMSHAVETH